MKLVLNPFTFPDLTEPKGLLPRDMRAQACWYFYTLAESLRVRVGNSTEDQFGMLEGDLWMDKRYVPIARAVATMYSLESPAEFQKFWKYVWAEAQRSGYPLPAPEYSDLHPGKIVGAPH